MEAFWKFFWIALRGALYTAAVAATTYITNFHPQQWDVPLFVGIAMFVESMVAAGGKWVAINGAKNANPAVAALAPVVGDEISQVAPQVGDAVLAAARRNDPAVPSVLPPTPDDTTPPETPAAN